MKRTVLVVLAAVAVGGLWSVLALTGPLQRLEWQAYDWHLRARGDRLWNPPATAYPVRVIVIDDESLQALRTAFKWEWPWPHTAYAALLEALFHPDSRPRAVAFDIKFQPANSAADKEADAALAARLKRFGPVCLAYYFEDLDGQPPDGATTGPASASSLDRMALTWDGAGTLLTGSDARLPPPDLTETAPLGAINAPRDPDGVLRRIPLVIEHQGRAYPSLALTAVMAALECEPTDAAVVAGRRVVFRSPKRPGRSVPLSRDGQVLLNFPGRWTAIEAVPFYQVLRWGRQRARDPEAARALAPFKDSVVFVGVSTSADALPTPLERLCPGVATHAVLARQMLGEAYLRECPWAVCALWVGVVSVLAGALATWPGLRWGAPGFAALLVAAWGAAFGAFHAGWVVWTAAPLLAAVTSFTGFSVYRQAFTERHRRRIRRLFGQYLSPEAVREIVDQAEGLALTARRAKAAVLFSDIRGFTGLTERLGAAAVVELLNEYFEVMTEVIQRHGGAVNKLVGDEIFATFGVPLPHPDDSRRAVRAAVEMQERLGRLRQTWKAQGRPELHAGIGVSSGEVVAGTIGCERRRDYTAIGDAVNLGARLQELTKTYGERILVSQAVWEQVKDEVTGRPLGEAPIRGRSGTVQIYAIDVPPAGGEGAEP